MQRKPQKKQFSKPFEKKPQHSGFKHRPERHVEQRATPPRISVHLTRITGIHATQSILEHDAKRAVKLYIQRDNPRCEHVATLAASKKIPVERIGKEALAALCSSDEAHQGVLLACEQFSYVDLEETLEKKPQVCVVLDQVEDPRNLGRAARSAYALGADLLIIPQDRSAGVTPIAEKTAVGTLSRLPVAQVVNLARALRQLKNAGFTVVGAAGEATTKLWDIDLRGHVALVIGNEETGLRRLTKENCDILAQIPMKTADISLNAADAACVFLYETARQNQK